MYVSPLVSKRDLPDIRLTFTSVDAIFRRDPFFYLLHDFGSTEIQTDIAPDACYLLEILLALRIRLEFIR